MSYSALGIQLTQSSDASENPERLGFGSGNADFHDEVGGVSGGGQDALPLGSLVKRTLVARPLGNVRFLDRN